MRDPNRIDEFCRRLAAAWKNIPDWRFGQLVENLKRCAFPNRNDLFYTEDDEMIDIIENYLRGY